MPQGTGSVSNVFIPAVLYRISKCQRAMRITDGLIYKVPIKLDIRPKNKLKKTLAFSSTVDVSLKGATSMTPKSIPKVMSMPVYNGVGSTSGACIDGLIKQNFKPDTTNIRWQ